MSGSCYPGGCNGCGSENREFSCQGSGCGPCSGQRELLLCREEADILLVLGQYAFLPVLAKYEGGEPKYVPIPEDTDRFPPNFSELVLSLERKRLISLDSDIPLPNADYGKIQNAFLTRCGSLALTLQGQEALDWLGLTQLDTP